MCTRGEYQEYISRLAEPRRKQSLSGAALEVLAIVAYKQPVTRSTVEHLRGVNCDYIVNRLIERSLIEEVGRLDAPGRPILFGTTQEFLRCFGIATLDDLPDFESFGDPAEEGSQIEMNFDNAEAQDTTPTPEDEQPGIMMNQMETFRQPLNSNTPDVPPPSAQDIAD